jgi:hypothetical protein
MLERCRRAPTTGACAVATLILVIASTYPVAAAGPDEGRDKAFAEVRPVVARLCGECHSKDRAEADIDLTAFAALADVRRQIPVWQKVGEMIDGGQMPPKEAIQPTDAERALLRGWLRGVLKDEASRHAGDPGPVVLRRLSNAEYTYALRDLTGISSLSPAREFPIDGAAGEGFTNAAAGLVMSPSLLVKYVDAGKAVAAHAVLLPDGIRFSPSTTRRDATEETLAEIRHLYDLYSGTQGGTQVNLQGIVFDTNGGGRLPVERYLEATIAERETLTRRTKTIEAVAHERNLSPKYLGGLWSVLSGSPAKDSEAKDGVSKGEGSLLLDGLRTRWRTAKVEDVPALTADVARWQRALWKFSSVGHIGKAGGPKAWMEPVNPLAARQDVRIKLPESTSMNAAGATADADKPKDIVLYLTSGDAGDGNLQDFAVWEQPRLVVPGRPELLLRDVRRVTAELLQRRRELFAGTSKALAAAAEASAATESIPLAELSKKHGVDEKSLAAWFDSLGLATGPAKNGTPITGKTDSISGYDFIKGWTGADALSVLANSSDQAVRVPGHMPPHSVAVHPAPTIQVVVGWKAPAAATLRIDGMVQHAHPECGNGIVWSLELRRGSTRQPLANGRSNGPNKVAIGPMEKIAVRAGDFVSLAVGPRDGNHSCDLTGIDLTLNDGTKAWNLAKDVSSDILAANPHADAHGNAAVWHFDSEPATAAAGHVIPAGSLLSKWQTAAKANEKQKLADELQRLLTADAEAIAKLPQDSPDRALHRQLNSLSGPLLAAAGWSTPITPPKDSGSSPPHEKGSQEYGLDPNAFGKHPDGSVVEPGSLCVRAPSVIEVRLPADLVAGAEFVTSGVLHPSAKEGSVQLQVLTTKPDAASGLKATDVTESNAGGAWTANNRRLSHAAPIIVADGSDTRRRFEAAFDDYRRWFPAALCYTKIVPVDEVVTLTLYHREDDALRRLMLNDDQTARLNQLWNELHFISQDALTLVDAYEQLWQYATQDADPKVFEPMRKPILDRAAAFRKQMLDAEPKHVDAVLRLAALAWRRPLTESESTGLRELYATLREEDLPHEASIRLLLTRVMAAPGFLYRAERAEVPVAGANVVPPSDAALPDVPAATKPITANELATRLSFFLWSSLPDDELRKAAEGLTVADAASVGGTRNEQPTLAASATKGDADTKAFLTTQTRRMLKDAKARRMATEFACQWLHVYEFDQHDEKSEAAFPTFNGLRGAMYEEPIQFFTDLVQRDGSLLEVLDADHTFVNEDLAKHYGIAGVTGPEWRRVAGMKKLGRGGILGMASTLSKQSGASRTSPILRGNWVCEVLLGEKLPRPPKGVPVLPDTVPAGLTERQLIEKHSSVAACAKCHARIDPIGFSLEGFDAIGRDRRSAADLPKIDTKTKLADGTEIDGLDGLRNNLLTTRRDEFVRQFCRKLLGYALGRGVQLSDEPLLDEMQSLLKANGYHVSVAIDAIVHSRQFLTVRTPTVAPTGKTP